jgi:hypothetical protein
MNSIQLLHSDRGRILFSRDTTPLQRPRRVNWVVRPRNRGIRMSGRIGFGRVLLTAALWSIAGGGLCALGIVWTGRFVHGSTNAHAAVIVYFVPVVVGILLTHAGPLLSGWVQQSWLAAAVVAALQPVIAAVFATCWFLAGPPPENGAIPVREVFRLAAMIAAGLFAMNVLPLSIGRWFRSWRVAAAVALLQPFALLILAFGLLLTGGLASPR